MLKQLLTGKDNETQDFIRWLGVLSVLIGLGLEIYVIVWLKQVFDLTQFGLGMGAVFTSLGAALNLKSDTEPS
jgi:hypothetical protein